MSLFSICFETDITIVPSNKSSNRYKNKITSGAYGDNTIPNKDVFTKSNILNLKTRIISNKIIKKLQEHYKNTYSYIKLWLYDINININVIKEIKNLVCIILFISSV